KRHMTGLTFCKLPGIYRVKPFVIGGLFDKEIAGRCSAVIKCACDKGMTTGTNSAAENMFAENRFKSNIELHWADERVRVGTEHDSIGIEKKVTGVEFAEAFFRLLMARST